MHNDRSAKLRRRKTAFANAQRNLQRWKDAASDDAITGLLSNKDMARIERGAQDLQSTRKNKIRSVEAEIATLKERQG